MAKTWSMNETQSNFVKVLKEYPNGVTLFELKLKGQEFKTGAINTLITKGIVEVLPNEVQFDCQVVYNGVVVGKCKKPAKVYKLVAKD